ncbi:hypothetical protein NKJ36_31210 [Mesorhizobium sp. M0142]|uniref:hypothetical protein n=1 Tax=unclassified Mesorhizobium TaxID=325217 RepID=UPI00333BAB13
MSIKKVGLLGLITLVFAAGFLGLVTVQRDSSRALPKPSITPERLEGTLFIQTIDDLRVGGHKILLCGVAFSRPPSMRGMVTDAARRDYQGLAVTCKPVGTGTPCDGNAAPKFGDALVVQCFTPDGSDLAAKLVESGVMCGQMAQAGATYKRCPPAS